MSDGDRENEQNPPAPTSIETAMPVENIRQEYTWVKAFTCRCGATGTCEVQRQALLTGEGDRYYDLLETRCSACGAEYGFYFDVTRLFEGYAKMLGHSDED
ncbi:MAG: hypothetical protein J7M38_07345 [Armatimonadetes bacterium]|nr:hypothetical protein [Armatimonadota bacterium]